MKRCAPLKWACLAGVMLLCSGLCLAGYGWAQSQFVSIGTSDAGGTYNFMGTAMAKVISKYLPHLKPSVEATPGGGMGNIRLLAKESITFGIAGSDAGYSSYRGEGPFAKEKNENLRTALTGLELQCHFIVLAASKIKSLSDLRGKSIVANSAGNAAIYAPQTLEAYGLKAGDYKISMMATNEAVEALKDGRVDAILTYAVGPAAAFMDLALRHDVHFLPVAEDKINSMIQKYPYYKKFVMKPGFYPKQPQEIRVSAITSILYTHSKIEEQLVYTFVKALLEHSNELAEIHPAAGAFNIERQKEFLGGTIIPPLHSGVVRYYKEKGLLK